MCMCAETKETRGLPLELELQVIVIRMLGTEQGSFAGMLNVLKWQSISPALY